MYFREGLVSKMFPYMNIFYVEEPFRVFVSFVRRMIYNNSRSVQSG